jgi:hypothetical protein
MPQNLATNGLKSHIPIPKHSFVEMMVIRPGREPPRNFQFYVVEVETPRDFECGSTKNIPISLCMPSTTIARLLDCYRTICS